VGGGSLLVCVLLSLLPCSCGEGRGRWPRREGLQRIIGGSEELSAYPWVVRIYKIGGESYLCSGSLISSHFVMTAAHCIINEAMTGWLSMEPLGSTAVHVGCSEWLSPTCRSINVTRAVVHPCYTLYANGDQPDDHDDIALLELEHDAGFPTEMLPYVDNLNGTADLADSDTVTLAGFGLTNASDPSSIPLNLMAVSVPKASRAACEAANPTYVEYGWTNLDTAFCTGGEAGKDSCNGDSGGPVIKSLGWKNYVVGITSIGSEKPEGDGSCAAEGRYAVNTLVSKYADFIYETMQRKAFSCTRQGCLCEAPAGYWQNRKSGGGGGATPP